MMGLAVRKDTDVSTEEEVVAAVRAMREAQQIRVLDALMKEVYATDPSLDSAWERELARREQALEMGEATLIDGDEVIASLRRGLPGGM